MVIAAVLIGAAAFALEGGEYGTSDLVRQQRRRVRLVRQIDSLKRVVDSLAAYKRRVEIDPAVQERIAREECGMIRGDKERLYRFGEPRDSVRP
ncbi:MAG: hypothetical protein NVS9B3_09650 [Gemmatimonadaceae bacterium]